MTRVTEPARAGGFTLLEVVVALIVFALVFGVVTEILQTGFRQSRVATETTLATLLARSVMERLGSELPIEAGRQEGEAENGYRWVVEIERAPTDAGGEPPIVVPYFVDIQVSWGDLGQEQAVELTTLRLAPAGR